MNEPSEEDLQKGMERGLHLVVGHDGVLMISLPRDEQKADKCKAELSEVGIYPRTFEATDYRDPKIKQATLEAAWNMTEHTPDLDQGDTWTARAYRWMAAVADSHRRALAEAQARQETWTAILEDDVVPMLSEGMTRTRWIESLESAWDQLPPDTRIVRLAYCNNPGSTVRMERDATANANDFMITNWTFGICTTGYVIHKDAIPELLSAFPCQAPLDLCWWALMPKLGAVNIELNVDIPEMTYNDTITNASIQQYGILRQDWQTFPAHYSNASYFASLADALSKVSPQNVHPRD